LVIFTNLFGTNDKTNWYHRQKHLILSSKDGKEKKRQIVNGKVPSASIFNLYDVPTVSVIDKNNYIFCTSKKITLVRSTKKCLPNSVCQLYKSHFVIFTKRIVNLTKMLCIVYQIAVTKFVW
jgi:hypothetical protein